MVSEEQNSQLLLRIERGDKSAFEELVSLYEKPVYRICYRFFNNDEDALDAAQEVFIKVYRNIKNFQGRSSFSTWLYRIAANTCITISGKKKREKEGLLQSVVQWWNSLTSKTPEEEVLERSESLMNQKKVNEAVAKLPETYRMPLILKDIESMPMEKISQVLDIPLGTVKSRLNRGRAMLHDSLEAYMRLKESEKM